ncbi:permease [Candidatus Marsarchaeota G1 archaeon BE_D]|jgi:drug/metabolite transporter (DMT)-like permease|uniref:Permease n=1 Tax=Candidatus Marsarchaeota G1 archaeon BE_D TaxID=1978156 RepID=A0A2R6ABK0_9ARCH|nr:MAG: permease [Candidatus Marsarchaeota G1 archaeon BE_D]
MLGVALSWGLSYPLSKIALSYISPFVLTFLRFSLGALFLLPFAKGVSAGKPQALSALLNNALFVVILNFALLYSSNPALTSVLIYTQPVFVMVLERAFFGKKTTKKQSLGVLLAFFGVALSVGSASFDLGSFLAVLDGFLWSVGTLYHQKRLVNSNLLQLNAFMTLFSALIVSPTLLLNHSFVLTRESLLLSLLVPLSAQTLGFLFWFNAVNRLGAIRASSLSLLVPISAYLLSFALLGKTPTKFEFVGSAITLIGVYLTQRG